MQIINVIELTDNKTCVPLQ